MSAAADTNHYKVLGVPPTASPCQIKQAYRRLVRLWHPDLHDGDPHATQVLQAINAAYEILADPQRRAAYDREREPRPENDAGGIRSEAPPRGAEQPRGSAGATPASHGADRFDRQGGRSTPAPGRGKRWKEALASSARPLLRILMILALVVAALIVGVQVVQLLLGVLLQALIALIVPLTPLIAVWKLLARVRKGATRG